MLGCSHIAAYSNPPLRDIIQRQIQTSHDFQSDAQKTLGNRELHLQCGNSRFPEAKHFSHAKLSSHVIGHGKHRAASKFLSLSLVLLPVLPIHLSLIHTQFNEATLKCLLYSIEFLLIGSLEGQRWQNYLVILSFICPALTGSICAF